MKKLVISLYFLSAIAGLFAAPENLTIDKDTRNQINNYINFTNPANTYAGVFTGTVSSVISNSLRDYIANYLWGYANVWTNTNTFSTNVYVQNAYRTSTNSTYGVSELMAYGGVLNLIESLLNTTLYGATNAHPVLAGSASLWRDVPRTWTNTTALAQGTNLVGTFYYTNYVSFIPAGQYGGHFHGYLNLSQTVTCWGKLVLSDGTTTNVLAESSAVTLSATEEEYDIFFNHSTNAYPASTNVYLGIAFYANKPGVPAVSLSVEGGTNHLTHLSTPSLDAAIDNAAYITRDGTQPPTADIDWNDKSLTGVKTGSFVNIAINTNTIVPAWNGIPTVFFDADHNVPAMTIGPDVTRSFDDENLKWVRNTSGFDLTNGVIVYMYGTTGHARDVNASANTNANTAAGFGMVTQGVITNNEWGFICTRGTVHELDTSGLTLNDIFYITEMGAGLNGFNWHTNKPNHELYRVIECGRIGTIHATQGDVEFRPRPSIEVTDIYEWSQWVTNTVTTNGFAKTSYVDNVTNNCITNVINGGTSGTTGTVARSGQDITITFPSPGGGGGGSFDTNMYAFSVYCSSNFTVGANTTTKIPLDTETFDPQNMFGSTNRFYPVTNGYYQISAQCYAPDAISLQVIHGGIVLYKDGAKFREPAGLLSGTWNQAGGVLSCVVYLTTTNYLEVYARNWDTDESMTFLGGSTNNWFDVHLIK